MVKTKSATKEQSMAPITLFYLKGKPIQLYLNKNKGKQTKTMTFLQYARYSQANFESF